MTYACQQAAVYPAYSGAMTMLVPFRDALPISVNNYVLERELAIEAAEAVQARRQ
jgi:hypothetical protein